MSPCNSLSKALAPSLAGGAFFLLLSWCSALLAAEPAGTLKPIEDQAAPALEYALPKPGSYELMRIMAAADGQVLDTDGRPRRLHEFTRGKVTLLSFIYSTCADPNGCPYAYLVFHHLKNRLGKEPKLRDRVRLVSLSFDPQRDTPEMLRLYAGDNVRPGQPVPWDFLTTASYRELIPILDAFGQDVFVEVDAQTQKPLGTLSHVLKIFLIDPEGVVREVYTTVYLQADVVYNDILNLLVEQGLELP